MEEAGQHSVVAAAAAVGQPVADNIGSRQRNFDNLHKRHKGRSFHNTEHTEHCSRLGRLAETRLSQEVLVSQDSWMQSLQVNGGFHILPLHHSHRRNDAALGDRNLRLHNHAVEVAAL